LLISPRPLLIAYFVLGVFTTIFGPIEYKNLNSIGLLVFMGLFLFVFFVGFGFGSKGMVHSTSSPKALRAAQSIFTFVLFISFTFSAFFFTQKIWHGGFQTISFSSGAQAYLEIYSNYERNSGSLNVNWLLSELVYPLQICSVAFTTYYFKSMKNWKRIVAVINAALLILTFGIMAGKQKIIGDVVIVVGFVGLVLLAQQRRKLLTFALLGLTGSISLFALLGTLAGRYSSVGINLSNINDKIHPLMHLKENSALIDWFGAELGFSLIQLSGYFTNGYYGLSLALTLPFEWTGFIGNSYSLMVIYNRFFGGDFLLSHTYPARVGEIYGWGVSKWHSAFAWYASDFTFFGTILFFFLVSFIYGRLWRDLLRRKNPFAVPLYSYLSIGFIFIPANNQLLLSPGGVLTLFSLSVLWMLSRKFRAPLPTT
jgi:hypothetical protein